MRFAIPLMLSLFLQALYGAIDLIVVGQFGSTASISAVTTDSQLMVAVTTIVTGKRWGHGFNWADNGAKNTEKAGNIVCGMSKLFSVITVFITAILVIFQNP